MLNKAEFFDLYRKIFELNGLLGYINDEIAEKMYERHTLISTWLKRLGVPEEIATEDACRIEHVISTESFEAIKAHIEKAE